MIYYIALALSPLLSLLITKATYKNSINENKKGKRTFLFLCGIALFLMIALRDKGVGSPDSLGYYNNWKILAKMDLFNAQIFIRNNPMEPGYLYSVWVLSHIFIDPQWLFVFSGLFFTISICRFIYINSDDALISIIMFICLGLYSFMVQGLRQAIAMAICLFALEFAKKRRPFSFFALMLIAWFFHRSSIAFCLTYFLFWKEYTTKVKIQILLMALLILLATPLVVQYGNKILDREYKQAVESGGFVSVAIYLIIILTSLLFIPKQKISLKKEVCNTSFFLAITIVGAAFYMMRYMGVLQVERVSFYFAFGQLVLLPQVTKNFDKQSRLMINIIIITLSTVLFIYRLNGSELVPYSFFWQ